MKFVYSAIATLIVVAFLTGCCSIVNGTRHEIGVSSTPTGAEVFVDGARMGSTPATLDLERDENHKIRLELKGYQPYEITLTKSVSGWVWGNVAFGGLIGLAIDALNGSVYKLSPEQVSGKLRKKEKDAVHVEMTEGKPENADKIGQMEKSPAEKLKELKELKQESLITDEEYEEKRESIIDQLDE